MLAKFGMRCSFARSLTYRFFFFNDPATPEIYTLSLHDALPISRGLAYRRSAACSVCCPGAEWRHTERSEEHTSELQSLAYLVCRLLLEKKKIANSTRRDHDLSAHL